jgi:hypothetical protein
VQIRVVRERKRADLLQHFSPDTLTVPPYKLGARVQPCDGPGRNLQKGGGADLAERERVYASMVAAERKVRDLDPKFKALIRQSELLKERLAQVHRQHALHGVTRAEAVR